MQKRHIHIIIFIGIFIALLVIEYLAPKPVDWTMSFERYDKVPYGSYILYDLLPDIFPESEINQNELSLYELGLDDKFVGNSNLIIINNEFSPDDLDANQLLDFVSGGGNAFIAANNYGGKLADTLNLRIDFEWLPYDMSNDSLVLNFVSNQFRTDSGYVFSKGMDSYFFTKFDTLNTTILGERQTGDPNFIKTAFGEGYFYLHTQPLVFTNYNLLHGNGADYAYRALSYLPDENTLWDEYYKLNRNREKTPLRYILREQPLKSAYILLITLLVVYVVFEVKRRQRIVPLIKPLPNTSLEFIETIGRLYMSSKNHKDLAVKKFSFLLEFLRSHYYIMISVENILTLYEEFTSNKPGAMNYEKISAKTDVSETTVLEMFEGYWKIQNKKQISEKELLSFAGIIESFYAECK